MPPCFPDVLGSLQPSPVQHKEAADTVPVLPELGPKERLGPHFPLPRGHCGSWQGRARPGNGAPLGPSFLTLCWAPARRCCRSNVPVAPPLCGPNSRMFCSRSHSPARTPPPTPPDRASQGFLCSMRKPGWRPARVQDSPQISADVPPDRSLDLGRLPGPPPPQVPGPPEPSFAWHGACGVVGRRENTAHWAERPRLTASGAQPPSGDVPGSCHRGALAARGSHTGTEAGVGARDPPGSG